jgi:hypothetical protein
MIRPVRHPDLIPGGDVTLGEDSQVCPRTQCFDKAPGKVLIVHPNGKTPTRHARLGDLEKSGPDLPLLPDARATHVDPFGREVFAKLAKFDRTAELLFPPPKVLNGVCVNSFVRSAVCLAICLVVSIEVDASDSDTAVNW